jgi:hypothetical protein
MIQASLGMRLEEMVAPMDHGRGSNAGIGFEISMIGVSILHVLPRLRYSQCCSLFNGVRFSLQRTMVESLDEGCRRFLFSQFYMPSITLHANPSRCCSSNNRKPDGRSGGGHSYLPSNWKAARQTKLLAEEAGMKLIMT